jgi:formylglycine-generating enzyme required for sulfatase activity
MYQEEPDPGLHGAAEWLLRQRNQQAKIRQAERGWMKDQAKRNQVRDKIRKDNTGVAGRWYVNSQGQTMVVIGDRVGGFALAIAAKEVTVGQFLRFRKQHNYIKEYSPTAEHPVNTVDWKDAAEYCNWLSEQEGIPVEQWCYERSEGGKDNDVLKLKSNCWLLEGYRLPSVEEWEYACRAGSIRSRYYGETEELLDRYAWYTKNSQNRWMREVGSLKPNDFGLFDMLGNAIELCLEQHRMVPRGLSEVPFRPGVSGVTRGGSFLDQALDVQASDRLRLVPKNRIVNVGFRPVCRIRRITIR